MKIPCKHPDCTTTWKTPKSMEMHFLRKHSDLADSWKDVALNLPNVRRAGGLESHTSATPGTRPPRVKFTDINGADIIIMRAEGYQWKDIAAKFKAGLNTVRKAHDAALNNGSVSHPVTSDRLEAAIAAYEVKIEAMRDALAIFKEVSKQV